MRARGFTLIELLVASALLAILAVIGWRGLDAVLTSRDRIVERSDELQAMSVAFSQMDEDLRRSWPVRLLGLAVPTLTFRPTDAGMTLQLLREGGGASDPSRIERVAYRLRDGLLERGFGPLLAVTGDGPLGSMSGTAAAGGSLPLSDAPLIWQPLLRDVSAVRYRGWLARRGWIDAPTLAAAQAALAVQSTQAGLLPGAAASAATAPGATSAGAATAAAASGNPAAAAAAAATAQAAEQRVLGVEIELLRANGERYVRVFPVQD